MPAADKPFAIMLEREILRVLCGESVEGSARSDLAAKSRTRAIADLRTHNWQDAEHQVVFDALARLPGRDAAELRRQLPAQATRMGFPDVRWEIYFASGRPDDTKSADEHRGNLETLIAQLRAAATESTT